jgi:hypothetical protein
MPSDIAQKVIGLLTPAVGEFLAKAKVTAACRMAGTNLETLSRTQLKDFSDKLESVCNDLGPNVAKGIKSKVLAI